MTMAKPIPESVARIITLTFTVEDNSGFDDKKFAHCLHTRFNAGGRDSSLFEAEMVTKGLRDVVAMNIYHGQAKAKVDHFVLVSVDSKKRDEPASTEFNATLSEIKYGSKVGCDP